jgi:D-tyrosyl-tRNA(Tyr) deacylase
MLALIQRVKQAAVDVSGERVGAIGPGLLVFLGVERDDGTVDAERLLKKVLAYRVFTDADGKMNLSVQDVKGGVLVVSPSFSGAKAPVEAEQLYEFFLSEVRKAHQQDVACGRFGADMQVSLVNDGPVTFLLRS